MVNLLSTAADKLLFGICTVVDHVFYDGEIRTRYRAPAEFTATTFQRVGPSE